MVGRRAAGEPLEHILGWAEFCGLRIAVEPGVFVPRRRTEFLVHQAVQLAAPGAVIVDLCCGTGAIGAALAAAVPAAKVHAADIDPAAVRCARRNLSAQCLPERARRASRRAAAQGLPERARRASRRAAAQVHHGDLYAALPSGLRGRVGIVVANVPYVPSGEIALLPAEARAHEPTCALDGGGDGLNVLRRVAAGAPQWLAPGGHLLIETSARQAPAAAEAFTACGLAASVAASAELGATVVIGTVPR
ncbi:MAG: methyltransferase [Streptosporangiaceae bacterium]|nr:methyltransferase [Streptosporangiaceae bacterium]